MDKAQKGSIILNESLDKISNESLENSFIEKYLPSSQVEQIEIDKK